MMWQTIGENQDIYFKNVISRYYDIQWSEMQEIFSSFIEEVLDAGYSANGPFFYSINSSMTDQSHLIMELFLPVHEENQQNLSEEFLYHSRFQVLNLVAIRVKGDNEEEISKATYRLAQYIADNRYRETTPPFYFVRTDDEDIYTDIMVGLA